MFAVKLYSEAEEITESRKASVRGPKLGVKKG
jgi:hypothetical protein